ncbi:MAG: tetratricopeptide repeat protein, partial [Anaerolineales bacterium]
MVGHKTLQGEGAELITPTPMAFYFRQDVPSQSAYLGLFTLGMTHIIIESSSELRQAVSYFDAAVASIVDGTQVKPWEAYVWRANCYFWLGEYEIALLDYDRALELNPEDASA